MHRAEISLVATCTECGWTGRLIQEVGQPLHRSIVCPVCAAEAVPLHPQTVYRVLDEGPADELPPPMPALRYPQRRPGPSGKAAFPPARMNGGKRQPAMAR